MYKCLDVYVCFLSVWVCMCAYACVGMYVCMSVWVCMCMYECLGMHVVVYECLGVYVYL